MATVIGLCTYQNSKKSPTKLIIHHTIMIFLSFYTAKSTFLIEPIHWNHFTFLKKESPPKYFHNKNLFELIYNDNSPYISSIRILLREEFVNNYFRFINLILFIITTHV